MDEATDEAFFTYARTVIDAGDLRKEAAFIQHGSTTTLLHSLAVAYLADAYARALGYRRLDEVRRAGLLHDYYLYDWHDGDPSRRWHGFTHGRAAADRAAHDYPDLTERELEAIRRHMFPFTPLPPRHGVGTFITMADKRCATYETTVRSGRAYPRLRDLAATYLPDVELGGGEAATGATRQLVPIPMMPVVLPIPAFAPAVASRVESCLGLR